MRIMVSVLADIASGKFAPDNTRSGQLIEKISSESSSAARSSSSEDPEAEDKESDSSLPAEFKPDRFLRNDSSRRIHMLRSEGGLACGDSYPVRYSILDDLPVNARFCCRCF